MEITDTLREIGDTKQPLQHRKLKELSNIAPGGRAALLKAWLQIEPTRRREISAALVTLGEDDVEFNFHELQLAALDDPDAEVRVSALGGLWELNSPTLLARMATLARSDPSGEVRAAAAMGLGRFMYLATIDELSERDAQTAHDALLAVAGDADQPMDARRRALESLGYVGGEEPVAALIERAYDAGDQLERESALVAMGRSMQERWLPRIGHELAALSPALRYEAARAMGEMSDVATPLLSRLLPLADDLDDEVSAAAIWALGQVGGPHAKRVLQRIARSKNDARRQAAADALDELTLGEDDPQMM
jgi:HEAT repeat protein